MEVGNYTTIEVELNEDNMERLKEASDKLNLSFSDIVADALDQYDLESSDELRDVMDTLKKSFQDIEQLEIECFHEDKK
jgi:hypothetical protein